MVKNYGLLTGVSAYFAESFTTNCTTMERRDFLNTAGLLAGFTALPHLAQAFTPSVPTTAIPGPLQPVLLPGQPPLDHNGSMAIRVWMRTTMTNGLFSSVECAVAPKTMGPAPHWHKELDELMYVLEGTASVLVGEEVVEISAGGWHLRPRMIKHTFFNAGDQPLRFVDMYFNQPFEEFLEKVFFEYTPEKGYPHGSKERDAVMKDLNEKFGLVADKNAGEQRAEIIKKYELK